MWDLIIIKSNLGTSLVVQWLKLCFHCSGGCGGCGYNPWFGELTSHMPRGQENHEKNNRGSTTKLLSSVHYFSKCRAHTSFNKSFNTLGKLQKKCSTYMVLHSLVVDSDNTWIDYTFWEEKENMLSNSIGKAGKCCQLTLEQRPKWSKGACGYSIM